MEIVAVTGGIASGKTEFLKVAKGFASVKTLQTDNLAKEIYRPENPLFKDVLEIFGEVIIDENCQVDVQKVRSLVFDDEELLQQLEGIAHPYVCRRLSELIKKYEDQGVKLLLVEIPLLFQSEDVKLDMFDHIVLVTASENVQIKRLMKRDNLSEKEAREIIKTQALPEEAPEKSDYLISTNGDLKETRQKAENLVEKLLAL